MNAFVEPLPGTVTSACGDPKEIEGSRTTGSSRGTKKGGHA
jgi:hypothetical protein